MRKFLLLALSVFIVISSAGSASAGSLKHCTGISDPHITPSCYQQYVFCNDWPIVPGRLVMFQIGRSYRDPDDLIAAVHRLDGMQFETAGAILSGLGVERANILATNVIAWVSKGHHPKDSFDQRVRADCVAGTLDFLDNEGVE